MDDEASTWLCLAVEFPFVVFHAATLICIVRCIRRKEAHFNSTFFKIYSMQSIADLVYYISSIFTFRLARLGYVPKWLLDYPIGNLTVFATRYCSYFQFVAHMIIAVNRYYAIVDPMSAKANPWVIRTMYAVLFAIPLPGAATRLLGKIVARPTDNPNVFLVTYDQAWVTLAGSVAFTAYSVITAVMSIGFELRTFCIYHGLDVGIRRSKKEDYRLLVYALTQFVAQFLQASYHILQAITSIAGLTELRKQTQLIYPYINDLLCLSGPICLFVTSSMFRQRFLEFLGARAHVTPVATMSSGGAS